MQDLPEWIDAYLDDMLSDEQHHLLSEWIQADPEHALQFARMHMLHDRLRNVLTLGPASFMTDQFVPFDRRQRTGEHLGGRRLLREILRSPQY